MNRPVGLSALDPDPAVAAKLRLRFIENIRLFSSLRQAEKWRDMRAASSHFIATATDIHDRLVLSEALCEERKSLVFKEAETLKKRFLDMQRRERPLFDKAIREAVEELGGLTVELMSDKISAFRPADLKDAIHRNYTAQNDSLRRAFVRVRVLAFRARVLGTYGETYNREVEKTHSSTESPPLETLLGRLVSDQGTFILGAYKRLHRAIRADRGITAPIQAVRDIEVSLRVSIGLIAGAAGAYVAGHGNAGFTDASIDLAVSATRTLAEAEVLYAFCSFLEAEATRANPSSWAHREAVTAGRLPLRSRLPRSTPVTIERILQGGLRKDRLYRVSGIVRALRIDHDPAPPKFSSFFQLCSPTTGAQLPVRAHMFSLANNGLTDGMACALDGWLAGTPVWSPDVPAMDIDRVELSRLRRSSWTDDVVYRMRTYSRRYPDEMNMAFAPIVPPPKLT